MQFAAMLPSNVCCEEQNSLVIKEHLAKICWCHSFMWVNLSWEAKLWCVQHSVVEHRCASGHGLCWNNWSQSGLGPGWSCNFPLTYPALVIDIKQNNKICQSKLCLILTLDCFVVVVIWFYKTCKYNVNFMFIHKII